MPDDDATRRFDERQFALILRKAAELQERDAARPARAGLTPAEIEAIAAEAGIGADYIRRAIATADRTEPSLWRRLAGPSVMIHQQHVVAGEVGPEAMAAMIDRLQAALGNPGVARDVLGGVEWTARDSFGKVHLTARPIAGETRIQLAADRSEAAAVLTTLLPIAGVIAGGVLAGAMEVVPFAGAVLGATAGIGAARLFWSQTAARWHRRLERLMGDLVGTTRNAPRNPDGVP